MFAVKEPYPRTIFNMLEPTCALSHSHHIIEEIEDLHEKFGIQSLGDHTIHAMEDLKSICAELCD